MDKPISLADLTSLCKRRGFIFQSSEIYGGINGFWDYGPLGTELKRNIREAWWYDMVSGHNAIQKPPDAPSPFGMVGVDTSIITHPQVWKVSGHYDLFHDQMVDCRETKHRYRYDQVRGRWANYGARTVFITVAPDAEDESGYVLRRALKLFNLRPPQADEVKWTGDFSALNAIEPTDFSSVLAPEASTPGTLTEPREFNLMFQTYVGPLVSEESTAFLRPETAQGIFLNFRNVVDSSRVQIPFGIAQIGRSFRNEITPRQFIFRSREFEQMEIEFFCEPSTSEAWYRYWRDRRLRWFTDLGIGSGRLRLREHAATELSHYSRGTADVEFAYPFLPAGEFGELEGVAHRGDFDLRSHMEGKLDPKSSPLTVELGSDGKPKFSGSGKNLAYFDQRSGQRYIPHVIEPSAGVDRSLLAFLCDALQFDEAPDESGAMKQRTVLRLHPRLAPVKAAVLPLVKKDGMPELGKDLYDALLTRFPVQYDEKDAIGRRYRRNDEIGTPICITIDSQTLRDQTVTFRSRDDLKQWRVRLEDCAAELERHIAPKPKSLHREFAEPAG
jgi:glycyl-tRNA synthetase